MKVREITNILEEKAPLDCAENWDNVGLLIGSREQEVKKILVALDANDTVIRQAIDQKADLLITHHPMLFKPLNKITSEDFIGRKVIACIQNSISYYAMHTNCDSCIMNEIAGNKIGLCVEDVLEVIKVKEDGEKIGIGQVGSLSEPMTVKELAEKVKETFGISYVRVTGNADALVNRVAISTGAGKSMMKYAIQKGAQVFISGDLDHHSILDAQEQDVQCIDAGHFGTEHFMVDIVCEYLREQLGEQVQIIKAEEENPFQVF